MKNLKVKRFEVKVNEIQKGQKEQLENDVTRLLDLFEKIEFSNFTNEEPFDGELKNKIIFTYCNHYRGNSGTWMEVGKINHPHINYEDRGYIKGTVTDLDGYMKLRLAESLNHNFENICSIYYPRFKKSKFQKEYQEQCNSMVGNAISELNEFVKEKKVILNLKLKDLTGCSLLHYLRKI